VTAVFDAPPGRPLLNIDGVSGTMPSFDDRSLAVLRWAASHYVAPLSTILTRTLPPNIPRGERRVDRPHQHGGASFSVVVSSAITHAEHVVSAVCKATDAGCSAMVIAPSIAEVTAIAEELKRRFGEIVVSATSGSSARDATRAWAHAAGNAPSVLVGTREILLWPVADCTVTVVVEDARRVLKSPSTPTLGVREVIVRKAAAEGHHVTFLSPVPTLESLAIGSSVAAARGRQWPIVEVADRAEEPPSRSLLLQRTRSALVAVVKRDARAFVLVPSRGYAPAFRCVRCGELRTCDVCGTAATRKGECKRCGSSLGACVHCASHRFEPLGAGIGSVRDAIARSVGDAVGVRGDQRPITVGTERDLVGHPLIDLAVSLDVDGLAHAPTYRASEDALRLLVRLGHLVRRGRGNRLLVQTALPDQPVVAALRSGRSETFLQQLAAERRRFSFPPFGELIALEITKGFEVGDEVSDALEPVATVLGPAAMGDRDRWLVQATDLGEGRVRLRRLVRSLRDRGASVRVDVDPIDL